MKAKRMIFVLAGVICLSLVACGDSGVQSVLENTNSEEIAAEEEYHVEIPEAVVHISEEDDKALTGVLSENSYTNPYFGLTFNKPEGGIIQSIMDDGTDLMPFAQTYTDGIGGIHINARNDEESISASIQAIVETNKGKTEEEFVQDKIESEKDMNEKMEIDSEITMETISIAGEEHPAYVEVYSDEGEIRKNVTVIILKGDFECDISLSASEDTFDAILGLIEKY